MKTKLLLTILIIFKTIEASFGQDEIIYHDGLYDLYKLIGQNVKYPPADRNKGVEGQVLLKFRIRDDHTIDSISILNSVSPAIDKEAVRVIQMGNGNWRVKETNFYLMPIVFKLSFPGRTENESIKRDIIRELQDKDYKKAIKNLNELRRRNPFDFTNLDNLIFAYNQIGDTENESKIRKLKEDIEYFRSKKRRIGEP